MPRPLEHDYTGLTDNSSMEISSGKIPSSVSSNLSTEDEKGSSFNLKETELRLGLPGSQSPDRRPSTGFSLFGKDLQDMHDGYSVTTTPLKNLFSGAKRGYSDALDSSCAEWVFSVNDGSEVEVGKAAALLSPKALNGGQPLGLLEGKSNSQQASAQTKTMKELSIVSQSSKPQQKTTHQDSAANDNNSAPAAKAQVVGWPPIRSFRKNSMASNVAKNNNDDAEAKAELGCLYVKVSMDGAPYLRKIDLKTYSDYAELSSALEKMFSCFTIGQCSSYGLPGKDGLSENCLKDLLHSSEYVVTYEDKDGDWMLVGDVPWGMFINSCKRLRIMTGSEAIGLAPSAMEKSKNRS